MKAIATRHRNVITAAMISQYQADKCRPCCRVCGRELKIGDYADPFHPYDHTGNLCAGKCAESAPERRGG